MKTTKTKKRTSGLVLNSFISKLAKTVGENGVSIKGESLDLIQKLMVGVLHNIAQNMNILISVPGTKKTLTPLQIKTAADLTFGMEAGEFTKSAFEFCDTQVELMESEKKTDLKFAVPRIARAFFGQISSFSPTKAPKRFKFEVRRRGSGSKFNITIAAILEHLCFRVLEESASQMAEDGHRARMNPRDIYLGIHKDDSLKHIFSSFITQGGVEIDVAEGSVEKKKKKTKKPVAKKGKTAPAKAKKAPAKKSETKKTKEEAPAKKSFKKAPAKKAPTKKSETKPKKAPVKSESKSKKAPTKKAPVKKSESKPKKAPSKTKAKK